MAAQLVPRSVWLSRAFKSADAHLEKRFQSVLDRRCGLDSSLDPREPSLSSGIHLCLSLRFWSSLTNSNKRNKWIRTIWWLNEHYCSLWWKQWSWSFLKNLLLFIKEIIFQIAHLFSSILRLVMNIIFIYKTGYCSFKWFQIHTYKVSRCLQTMFPWQPWASLHTGSFTIFAVDSEQIVGSSERAAPGTLICHLIEAGEASSRGHERQKEHAVKSFVRRLLPQMLAKNNRSRSCPTKLSDSWKSIFCFNTHLASIIQWCVPPPLSLCWNVPLPPSLPPRGDGE